MSILAPRPSPLARASGLCLIAASFLLPERAGATTISRRSLRELAEEAALVLEGEVVDAWVEPSAVTEGLYVTRIEILIDVTHLGSVASDRVVLTLPGGVSDAGVEDRVDGCPAYEVGDYLLFFAAALDDERVRLVDWTTGAVRMDPTGVDPSLWDAQGLLVVGAALDEWSIAVDEAAAAADEYVVDSAGVEGAAPDTGGADASAWPWLDPDGLRALVQEAVAGRSSTATVAADIGGAR